MFKGHTKEVKVLSLSLDGTQLASGGADNLVKLWHMKSGQCVRTLEHKGEINKQESSGIRQLTSLIMMNKITPLLTLFWLEV